MIVVIISASSNPHSVHLKNDIAVIIISSIWLTGGSCLCSTTSRCGFPQRSQPMMVVRRYGDSASCAIAFAIDSSVVLKLVILYPPSHFSCISSNPISVAPNGQSGQHYQSAFTNVNCLGRLSPCVNHAV